MTHRSENCNSLTIRQFTIFNQDEIIPSITDFDNVCLIVLPPHSQIIPDQWKCIIERVGKSWRGNATLITSGEPIDLVHVHTNLPLLTYQLWISIKRKTIQYNNKNMSLPNNNFGALVHTRYQGTLKHTITRIKYTYCPACDKTIKDYGGKKHTYNSYGTHYKLIIIPTHQLTN